MDLQRARTLVGQLRDPTSMTCAPLADATAASWTRKIPSR
jgi:hypothetical protein